MPFVPLHLRTPPASLPTPLDDPTRYGSPDLDPTAPYPWTQAGLAMGDYHEHDRGHNGSSGESSTARKRQRIEHEPIAIPPSIFGIAPRNDFTRSVGQWVMAHCRGVDHVELEIKLGTLMPLGDGPQHRLRLPVMSEAIMPPDYPVGHFVSNMVRQQHASLNNLLNGAVEGSVRTPHPLRFFRAQQVDSFHSDRGGRIRVSRDRQNRIVGVIRKRRLADLNIVSPNEAFDWRISASVEEPCDMPQGPPQTVRDKDRACYRGHLCQVDLTVVTSKPVDGSSKPAVSYELEIEVIDVPALVAEGEKEERGEENTFDDILQSCLDSVRLLIRNV